MHLVASGTGPDKFRPDPVQRFVPIIHYPFLAHSKSLTASLEKRLRAAEEDKMPGTSAQVEHFPLKRVKVTC